MKVGFIGLGNMGKPMSTNIATAGHRIKVYDTNRKAVDSMVNKCGAIPAESPADTAREADVVLMSLPTPQIVKEVVIGKNGVLSGLEPDSIIADLSTVTPSLIQSLSEDVKAAGGTLIDAPVSGGVTGAEAGHLTIMVGGDILAFERCRPLFDIIGKNIFHVGGPGSGNAVKILNQYLFAANLAALCEALTLATEMGVDWAKLFDILEKSSGYSYAVKTRREKLMKRSFEPGFQLQLMLQDIGLYDICAREKLLPLFIGDGVREIYSLATRKGYGSSDVACLLEAFDGIARKKNNHIIPTQDG